MSDREDLATAADPAAPELDAMPTKEEIDRTAAALEGRNIDVTVVYNETAASDYLRELIPADATVNSGHSTTMEQLGFDAVLEEADGFEYLPNEWENLEGEALTEAKREGVAVDVFFDSPNAIAQSGEVLAANVAGDALSAWPFAAERLVLVSGVNKIVPDFETAIQRVREYATPLEDERARRAGRDGSRVGQLLSYEFEHQERRTEVVLVDERLGF